MALQRHFNGTSIALQQQFNSRKKRKKTKKKMGSVFLSALVETVSVSCMQDFKIFFFLSYLKLILEQNVPSWKLYTAVYDHLQRGADCKAQ